MPDTFSSLLEFTSAAEVCWGRARDFVRQFSCKPEFSKSWFPNPSTGAYDWILPAADDQSRRDLQHATRHHDELLDAIEDWRAASSAIEYVNQAVGISLPPYFIGDESYQTAHEAAVTFAEVVADCWRSPDCWPDTVDGRVEFLGELAERLAELPTFSDPFARLQGEHYAASELTTCGESGADTKEDTPFIFAPLQTAIWKALDKRALKKQPLADEVCGSDGGRLYKRGGIKELMAAGKVQHKHGVGYFRPDAPPDSGRN